MGQMALLKPFKLMKYVKGTNSLHLHRELPVLLIDLHLHDFPHENFNHSS